MNRFKGKYKGWLSAGKYEVLSTKYEDVLLSIKGIQR